MSDPKDGVVSGTNKDDTIGYYYTGDPEGDRIDHNDGTSGTTGNQDIVDAKGGDDTVCAGADNDVVYGGEGDDLIYGGDGDDVLFGDSTLGGSETSGGSGSGSGSGCGGSGSGSSYDDVIHGGAGNDIIYGQQGDDVLTGGEGDDFIVGGAGDDCVSGDAGDDILFGDGANHPSDTPNLIVNGSFEDLTGLTESTFGYVGIGGVPGWTSADPALGIDIHGDARGDVEPADGDYWLDLEATPGNVTIGQDVAGVENGELYLLTFSAGDHARDENTFSVIWNGEVVEVKAEAILDPVNGGMQQYSVALTGGSGDGTNRLEFQGLGEENRRGVSIDNVKMIAVDGGAGAGDDTIFGGDGDDLIFGGQGQDFINGGDGDDVIYGDDRDNGTPAGGSGSGSGHHGSGSGHHHGSGSGHHGSGSGHGSGYVDACDLTQGVGFNGDTIIGGAGNDVIHGMSGHDYLTGGLGDDVIYGGSGNDKIIGGEGNDTLDGGDGDDCIVGGAGDDTLIGGDGSDMIHGGDDRDLIYGGAGDTVDGGSGGDDFDRLVVDPASIDHIEYTSTDHEDGIVHLLGGGKIEFTDIERVVPCFTPGTRILTRKGEVPIEDLKVGDKVVTRDNGAQEIRWIGKKTLDGRMLIENPHLRPILVRKGALGPNLPERDMMVSPNHRFLVANDRTSMLFEEREVLVAAKHLVDEKAVQQVTTVGTTYIHMLFDHHEVVLSDGSWSESFQPGDYSLKGIGSAERDEIFELFPELRDSFGREKYVAARMSLKKKEAQLLR
ncbi:MAG: Hint domain-containing protein [Rhodobacteraceae bacterium]|nr:Hint domain-containing protein [Paracoccaceae bacterium]